LIAFGLGPAQIIEQAPALGHHFEQPAARRMVLGVALQVFGQLPDPARQQRDLNVGAAGVLPVQLELLDIQRFRVLSHFEAPILDQESTFARAVSAASTASLFNTQDILDTNSPPIASALTITHNNVGCWSIRHQAHVAAKKNKAAAVSDVIRAPLARM